MKVLWLRFLSVLGFLKRKSYLNSDDVPKKIRNKFNGMFVNSSKVKWCFDNGNIESRFAIGDTQYVVWFKRDGTAERQYRQTKASEVPKQVMLNMTRNFEGYAISDIFYDELHNNPSYIIEFRKNDRIVETEFDNQGNRL